MPPQLDHPSGLSSVLGQYEADMARLESQNQQLIKDSNSQALHAAEKELLGRMEGGACVGGGEGGGAGKGRAGAWVDHGFSGSLTLTWPRIQP